MLLCFCESMNEYISQITQYMSEGVPIKQIGTLLGLNPSTVRHYIKRHNIVDNRQSIKTERGRTLSDKIKALIETGELDREIVARLGCDYRDIHVVKGELGLIRKHTSTETYDGILNEHGPEIIRLYVEELISTEQLATQFNITGKRIRHYLVQNGIATQPSVKIPLAAYKALTNQNWLLEQQRLDKQYKQLGAMLNVNESTVAMYFRRSGVNLTTPLHEKVVILQDKTALQQLYVSHSITDIAELLGVSHPIVAEAFDRLGIERDQMVSRSKGELQVVAYLKSILPIETQIVESCRDKLLSRKELDIYVPAYHIAIEFCGIYWHSEKFKPTDYHLSKLNEASEAGIRLITLFEDEWTTKGNVVKQKIAHIFGIGAKDRIYARKCQVIHLDSTDLALRELYENNHIQGHIPCSINYGLVAPNGQLVAAVSFKRHKQDRYDLVRFATNKQVVGGFSKLISHFKTNHVWREIFTYADKRWSAATNVYCKNGFELVHETKPAYWYVDSKTKTRQHRMAFQRKNLPKKLKVFDSSLTEHENANNNGYLKIFDCGHYKYAMYNHL